MAFGAALAAVLAAAALAQEPPDRPSPTFEETVEYINQKLASCPEPQVMRFSPPSKITVSMPLFVYRKSYRYNFDDRLDFPRVPGAVFEEWFDISDLSPELQTGPAELHMGRHEVYRKTFGGGGQTVYRVRLQCGKVSPCIHNGGWEIPARWRATHSEGRGDHPYPHPNTVDGWTLDPLPRLSVGSAQAWTLEGVQVGQLLVCDSDAAPRVGRAMTYLIRESGGRSKADTELF